MARRRSTINMLQQSHSQCLIVAVFTALALQRQPHHSRQCDVSGICAVAAAALAVYDSTRKMLVITGDERVFEVPTGFSERLYGFSNTGRTQESANTTNST